MIYELGRSIVEGGKIKIGAKGREMRSRGGNLFRLPEKHDYFTITTNQRDEHGDYLPNVAVMNALIQSGWSDDQGKIRQLPIALSSNDIEQVFPTALVRYDGRTLACRGDGRNAIEYEIKNGVRTGVTKEIPCRCPLLDERKCKYSGVFHCTLRLPGHGVIGSVYKWRTTSLISCRRMLWSLEAVLLEAGALRGLPGLVLSLVPEQVTTPDGKTSTVYVCHVELREDVVLAQRAALEAAQMRQQLAAPAQLDAIEASYQEILELPGTVDENEADVADEFYPPEQSMDTTALHAPLAAPRPETKLAEKKRPRRTRCKKCGEYYGPGVVKNGVCSDCRKEKTVWEHIREQENAPAAPPSRPVTPGSQAEHKTRLRQAVTEAIGRGISSADCMKALCERWPDAYDRKWVDDDEVSEAVAIIASLEIANEQG